ncbi:hypothetical protein P0Y67_18315 [Photobacterium sp. SP02]|uniref:hypothetical protein n=1 Tax=Photobacterium sp. SP02 TaxID=3032280 RepID=UPI003144F872
MNTSIAHCVTPANGGVWLHSCFENLLLAFLPEGTSPDNESAVFSAFEQAQRLFSEIQQTLGKTNYLGGAYLVSGPEMVRAMNTIKGMGQTSSQNKTPSYSGSPASVNLQFFQDVLQEPGPKLEYLKTYLLREMRTVQGYVKQSETEHIGILMCVVGLNALIGKTVTTFTYVTATAPMIEKFEAIDCESECLSEFQCAFDMVTFNYS